MCALLPPRRRRRPRAPAILGQREHWREHKTQCVKSVQRTGRPTSGAVPPARPTAQGPSRKGNQVIAGTPLYGDHFRASSPAALQRANAAGPPPGVPRRSRAELSRPPPAGARVGLRNEGNTCYLTCVLQALTYSPLAGYLLEVEVGNAPTKRGFNMMFELARHVRKVWSRNEMLSRCEPIAPVDPASDSDDEPDDGDDGAAAPGRRRRRAPRKRSTEELVVSKQLLSCTRHAGRMEDAHECLTYVLAQLLEACGVGYDGPTDAAWERSTLVHDVFECTLGQAVVCGACGFHSKAHSVELALRLNATLGLSPEELAKASAKDESPGLGGLDGVCAPLALGVFAYGAAAPVYTLVGPPSAERPPLSPTEALRARGLVAIGALGAVFAPDCVAFALGSDAWWDRVAELHASQRTLESSTSLFALFATEASMVAHRAGKAGCAPFERIVPAFVGVCFVLSLIHI